MVVRGADQRIDHDGSAATVDSDVVHPRWDSGPRGVVDGVRLARREREVAHAGDPGGVRVLEVPVEVAPIVDARRVLRRMRWRECKVDSITSIAIELDVGP